MTIFIETLAATSVDWNDIVREVHVFNTMSYKNRTSIKHFKWSELPLYPNCQVLDLMEYSNFDETKPTLQIMFSFWPKCTQSRITSSRCNMGITILPQERNKILKKRKLTSNRVAYSGSEIIINELDNNTHVSAILSLSQIIQAEKNPETSCLHYPTREFESFIECDEHFIRKRFLESTHQIMPFWAASNFSEVSMKRF